jgi:hypothetical protein
LHTPGSHSAGARAIESEPVTCDDEQQSGTVAGIPILQVAAANWPLVANYFFRPTASVT